ERIERAIKNQDIGPQPSETTKNHLMLVAGEHKVSSFNLQFDLQLIVVRVKQLSRCLDPSLLCRFPTLEAVAFIQPDRWQFFLQSQFQSLQSSRQAAGTGFSSSRRASS